MAESCVDGRRVVLIEPAGVADTAARIAAAVDTLTAEPLTDQGPTLAREGAAIALQRAFGSALGIDPGELALSPFWRVKNVALSPQNCGASATVETAEFVARKRLQAS